MITALAENKPVERTVEDVPQGAGHDQGKRGDQSRMCLPFLKTVDVYADDNDCNDPENAQQQLARGTAQGDAKSHAFIFRKVKDEEIPKNMDLFPNGHVCLDPDLQELVQEQYDKYDEERLFQTLGTCFSFASMLRVACGTLFSLSFAISLPVARQMP